MVTLSEAADLSFKNTFIFENRFLLNFNFSVGLQERGRFISFYSVSKMVERIVISRNIFPLIRNSSIRVSSWETCSIS